MRRFFAFIVLAITILTISIANIPSIAQGMNQGIEFKGGFEILYQVLDQDGEEFVDSDKASATASASEVISNRIDIAGVKNPQISIEGTDMVRVTIASKNESETASIRELLASNAEITFRDVNDNLLATAGELLQDNGAGLDYQDGSPVVSLKIKDTDLWTEMTTYISGLSDGSNRIVIWLGFEEKYAETNSYGFTGDSYSTVSNNPEAAGKMVSDATVSQTFYSDVIITGSFSAETAQTMANLIAAGTIDFTLKEISVTSVGAAYGSNAFNQSLIAGAIGLGAVAVLMIIFYGIAGVVSAISLVAFVVLILFGFNWLGGEYGPDTIAATVIAIGMAVDANIITFERIKDELYKGKSLRRAFSEGTTKSLSSIMDGNITTLIAAVSLYLFGTRTVKGFATMLIISIFFTVIVMVFISKGLLSLLCQSQFFQNKKNWFGVRNKDIPDVNKGESQHFFGHFAKVDFNKKGKWIALGTSSFAVLGLVVILIMKLATGSGLNLGIQFSQGTKLYYMTADSSMSTVEDVKNFFLTNEDITVVPDQVIVGTTETEVSDAILSLYKTDLDAMNAKIDGNTLTLYTVSCSFKTELNQDVMTAINAYFGTDHDTYLDIYDSGFTLNFVSPIVAASTVKNALYSLSIAVVFIILYIAWRFKWTFSISAIIPLIHDALFMLAFFAIFRIEVNIEFISAVLAIIGYSVNDTIVEFDRVRENIVDSEKKQLTPDERYDIVNKSLQQTIGRSIMTTVSTLLTVIALLIFGSSASTNFNIAMLVGLIAGTFSSVCLAPWIWLRLEVLRDKIKAYRKAKKDARVKVESGEPEEYIFYGINDYK